MARSKATAAHALVAVDVDYAAIDRVRSAAGLSYLPFVARAVLDGLRALAVPVLDRSGQAIGAINLSTHSTRTTRNEMREKFLPELKAIAKRISQAPQLI